MKQKYSVGDLVYVNTSMGQLRGVVVREIGRVRYDVKYVIEGVGEGEGNFDWGDLSPRSPIGFDIIR